MFQNSEEKLGEGNSPSSPRMENFKSFDEYMNYLKQEIDAETESVFKKFSRTSPMLNPSAVGIHSIRNRTLYGEQKRTKSMQLLSNITDSPINEPSSYKSYRVRRHSSAIAHPFAPKSRTESTSDTEPSFETFSEMTESTDLSSSSSSSSENNSEEEKRLKTKQKRSLKEDIYEYQSLSYRELFASNHLFSLDKIIHACLLNYFDDDEFVEWFLDIYPSFTDCNTLFKVLKKMFFDIYDRSVLDISCKSKEEHRKVTMNTLIRVVKFLEKFIQQDGDKITANSSEELFAVISQLQHIFQRVYELPRKRKNKKKVEKNLEGRITQLGKELSKKTHFFTITVQATDPVEIIVQITLKEHGIFQKMSKEELLQETLPHHGQSSIIPALPVASFVEKRESKSIQNLPTQTWSASPTIASFWVHSDKTIRWICSTILNCDNFSDRIAVLKKFINAAQIARSIRNYNAVFEVMAALVSDPIKRLEQTWNEISADDLNQFQKLSEFCSSENNFGEYRKEFSDSGPPCTPFLEAHISSMKSMVKNKLGDSPLMDDKLQVEEANKPCIDMHTRISLINELNDVLSMQKGDYPFKVSNSVRDFIIWQYQTNLKDTEELKKCSFELEPDSETI
eukprot:gb/GECH01004469.1/.p1 GENE.gb/GECH01004469.1/~~gb/GECH01004469.1/.p1  ORF type:complete len:622 (+),score=154.84 gb/GECH01004469.1/:1-1866(+)